MKRTGIITAVVLIGLLILVFAMVDSCHESNTEVTGDDFESEEILQDPEAPEGIPVVPVPVDTTGQTADTMAAPQP